MSARKARTKPGAKRAAMPPATPVAKPAAGMRRTAQASLSHVDAAGKALLVDVSGKEPSRRRAVAQATVRLGAAAYVAVRDNAIAKGDVLGIARIAGIAAAKETARLVPLCHPLALSFVGVELELIPQTRSLVITCEAVTTAPTGVEMEALVGASVAALTVYDTRTKPHAIASGKSHSFGCHQLTRSVDDDKARRLHSMDRD